jgi:hypothetical protein
MGEQYNGWINYETWAVYLWLSNEKGPYRFYHKQAQSQLAQAMEDRLTPTKEDMAVAEERLAEYMKTEHNVMAMVIVDNGLYSDLLTTSLGRVDWHEVARAFLEEV